MFETIRSINNEDSLRKTFSEVLLKLHAFNLFSPDKAREYDKFRKKRQFINDFINENITPHLAGIEASDTNQPIKYGIFQNIRYESILNLQAGIVQKLFGVYEIEISSHLLSFFKNQYDYVINIGAAEGLFSIIFEKSLPDTPIFSFEQDFHTRMLLRHMCSINQCRNVVVCGSFDLTTVNDIDASKRGFIFSDCEGFELSVFSPANIRKFENCDMVIETHDHIIKDVTKSLKEVLHKTHFVQEVLQISLSERAKLVTDPSFLELPEKVQIALLNEDRNPLNHWLVVKSKKHYQSINAD